MLESAAVQRGSHALDRRELGVAGDGGVELVGVAMPVALVCCVRASETNEGRPEGRPLKPMLAKRKRGSVEMTLLSFAMKMGVDGGRGQAVCPSPSASAACVQGSAAR